MSAAEPVRLQKHLAETGLCSRRAAEALIAAGEVTVNGTPAVLGQKITPGADRIAVRGKPVRGLPPPALTLALHKPRGLVCSRSDPHNARTVFELLPRNLARHRFFCAGRLDKDSEGLLILTTDGDLAHRLMHPSHGVVKRYHVTLEQPFPATRLPRLLKGVVLEGERLQVEHARLLNPDATQSSRFLDVHLQHGKKREIRQLFTALRYDVRRLQRYQIGALRLKGIPLRGGRLLSNEEIELLFQHPPSIPGRRFQPSANDHE